MAMELLIQIMLALFFIQKASAQESSVAKPGCPAICGNLTIPYPFGIGTDCSANQTFTIFCNHSISPPRAFLSENVKLEVLNISLELGTIQVNTPVITNCEKRSNDQPLMSSEPFTFSDTQNRLTAIGCETVAVISQEGLSVGGCLTFCNISSIKRNNSCFGSCCQTNIPPSLKLINASLNSIDGKEGCGFVFVVDQNWFGSRTDVYDVTNLEQVPAVLDWRPTGACNSFGPVNSSTKSSVCGRNSLCTDQGLCSCREGYEGNPYLPDGCQDINECETYDYNRCQQTCTNTPGSYSCSCINGWVPEGQYNCMKTDPSLVSYRRFSPSILIVTCTSLGVVLVLAPMCLYKVMKRRHKRKLREKFFKRNGGLLLHQQVSSTETNVETTKLFSSKELDKATNHYNVDRILGQGGQGTVYKGMLTDGRIVAVKKSKIEDDNKLAHFINEIIILSQINHRNVVRLHGCCLETEVPLLVYEFIPNGTLFQYIHDHNEDFPLTWDVRVRVATEVAGALSYLHSAAAIPVYHRDIKSSNILLDEKYRAKVADFGTSRSFSIDQSHVTTKKVQGTFGYFDPEYFRSSQFTDKSDVYSFGVVLVELLTGQKPIMAPRPDDEGRSLVTYFISAMEEKRILDIIDLRIAKDGEKEELIKFAELAYRCLHLKGRKRPTMKQVAAELDSIRMSHGSATAQQNYEDVGYSVSELNEAWDRSSTYTSSTAYISFTVDAEPLITK
ncbi:wall-associated receptor kinase-like 8 [Daucus carota subsp. sativus]|uniref:wall-associated receptor kinase-like 8 n=1 Tax=Daucus carota subsp. sativus TaxID=79200 RepID=UPI0007EF77FF|nr:PREDICTED: wall-associated receptor kinase-like 8 [Daucus carota subsp. sativus]